MLKIKISIDKIWFLVFGLIIVGICLWTKPFWSLMDDHTNLLAVEFFWSATNKFALLREYIMNDLSQWGIFRPVYHIWRVLFYKLFYSSPVIAYVANSLFLVLGMYLWKLLCDNITQNKFKIYTTCLVMLFPLFTPFVNLFSWISLQEKFLFVLAPIIFLNLNIFLNKEKLRNYFISILCLFLALMSKPTAIIFVAVVVGVLFLALFNKQLSKKKIAIALGVSVLVLIAYTLFTFMVQFKGNYAAKYGSGLTVSTVLNNFMTASFIIKAILLYASIAFVLTFLAFIKNRNKLIYIAFPASLLSYILILLPWGMPSYLLCMLAPFIFLSLLILVPAIDKLKLGKIYTLSSVVLIILSLLFVLQGRLAGKSETRPLVKYITNNSDKTYFAVAPLLEASDALSYFSKNHVEYLINSINLSSSQNKEGICLIYHKDSFPVNLTDSAIKENVYISANWQVWEIEPSSKGHGNFIPKFKQGLAQKIIRRIKNL